jgi:hypothetical protein
LNNRIKIEILCNNCQGWKIGDIIGVNEELANNLVRTGIAKYLDQQINVKEIYNGNTSL